MSHSRFSPSSAYRWLLCTKSLTLPERSPRKSNPAAVRGTVLHDYCDDVLNKRQLNLFQDGYVVTPEDVEETVKPYVEFIESIEADQKFYEVKVFINEDCYGTADCITYDSKTQTLHVVDLKCGSGFVSVNNNYQLMIYAIGAVDFLREKNHKVKKVFNTIFQPKAKGKTIKTVEVDFSYLKQFRQEVFAAIQAVLDDNAVFYADSKTCFWCDHKQNCPEIKREAVNSAKEEFEQLNLF